MCCGCSSGNFYHMTEIKGNTRSFQMQQLFAITSTLRSYAIRKQPTWPRLMLSASAVHTALTGNRQQGKGSQWPGQTATCWAWPGLRTCQPDKPGKRFHSAHSIYFTAVSSEKPHVLSKTYPELVSTYQNLSYAIVGLLGGMKGHLAYTPF